MPSMLGYRSPAIKFRLSDIFLTLIILMGFAIRLYKLGEQSLWYDETVSAFLASQSPSELIAHTARDIHPPGYYLLLHYWAVAAGNSEFALAFFSVVFGVLLIPLTYSLAQYLINRDVALWAALLVAVSPFNIWYSQEVRMYTLGAALGLIATHCALSACAASSSIARRYWAGYLVAGAAGLYALYYFTFLLLVVNLLLFVYMLYPKFNLTMLKWWLIANTLLLVAYLPWIPIAWRQATNPPVPPWRSLPPFWSVILESWSALSLGQSVEPATVWPVLLLTLILFGLGLYHLSSYPSRPAPLLVIYTFGPLLLIYVLSFITPLYHVRYIFTYSPPFYILLGVGLGWLATRTRLWVALLTISILIIAFLYSIYEFHFNPRYQADDYRAAVNFIESHWQPGDIILVNAGYTYPAFQYYAHLPGLERRRLIPYQDLENTNQPLLLQTGTIDGDPQLGWGDPRADFYAMSATETVAALEHISNNFSRLWMLRAYDTVTDPTGLIRTWLNEHTIPLEDQPFSGESNIRVQGFLLTGSPQPEGQSISFEDGMVLMGWYLPNQIWQAGQTIHIKLWWMTTAPPGADYKMSLKLWTPDGELAAQGQDEWPVGTLYRATDWPVRQTVYQPTSLTLPPDLPPGQYWLNVELYHPETIQPLSRQDNGKVFVTLGPVNVVATPD